MLCLTNSKKSVYLNYFTEHSCSLNIKEAGMRQESWLFKSPDERLTLLSHQQQKTAAVPGSQVNMWRQGVKSSCTLRGEVQKVYVFPFSLWKQVNSISKKERKSSSPDWIWNLNESGSYKEQKTNQTMSRVPDTPLILSSLSLSSLRGANHIHLMILTLPLTNMLIFKLPF